MTLYLLHTLFYIFIFPGLLFLLVLSLAAEYVDRKLYARMQTRVGPPWFQPFADLIKLLSKELIIPENADKFIFKTLPLAACTAAATAFLFIPAWTPKSLFSFNGDIVAVFYILTIPTLTYALGGWYSRSLYSLIGATRVLTQLFSYEVPLMMAVLAPGILAGSWTFSEVISFYSAHGWLFLVNIIGLAVAIVAVQGKLEKVPFDIPEAETEIVGGAFTEYTGPLYAYFRLAMNIQTISAAALISAVFLPFGYNLVLWQGLLVFLAKVLAIIIILAIGRTIFARIRMDQMVKFCWKYLTPFALLQILINIILKTAVK
ncbi:complex I subunit 1 family protein [Endomicrobium proavitum]|uniref:NADH dehydrogenase subunit H, ech hydrogenase subunit B n=1 Tax=Endomicrobium proavitum TaxID=1408281 RepID=A0A0G3WIU6_9BACT|nr:complex I subunit 1 family protein [Endomicrobium proavitum]AKL97419.1 NADH dehydrogenase subunit H, ech hydrogenase subunit B [Endomicrobium proavitum]